MRLVAPLLATLTLLIAPPASALSIAPMVILFPPDSARIEGQGPAILDIATQSFRLSGRILEIHGYTDRAGTTDHNNRLSLRRAEAVKAALVARGIPADAMVIRAHGETMNAIESSDGDEQPYNRRVEIVIGRFRVAPAGSP